MAPREAEDNAYANFWGDKQRAFMVCYSIFWSGQLHSLSIRLLISLLPVICLKLPITRTFFDFP